MCHSSSFGEIPFSMLSAESKKVGKFTRIQCNVIKAIAMPAPVLIAR